MSLKRWHQEKWTRPDGSPCGTSPDKKNPQKCRPSVKVSKSTPKTWGELSSSEKTKAIKDKQNANVNDEQYGKVRFSRTRKMLEK